MAEAKSIEATTIAILEDEREDRRARLSLLSPGGGLRLSDETYSPAVGWFVQGHVDLSPSQIADLRDALGMCQPNLRKRFERFASDRSESVDSHSLSVYRAG